jgi:hypothetical protein
MTDDDIATRARQLVEGAGQYVQDAIDAMTAATNGLNPVNDYLNKVKDLTDETTTLAADRIGEDHPATTAIVEYASHVDERVEAVQNLLQDLRQKMSELDPIILIHADTIRSVGERIQRALGDENI